MKRNESVDEGELALICRAAQGDHEAFRQLVISYEARLLIYLTQMLGDAENARDVAQETFVAMFHALPHWEPPRSVPKGEQQPVDTPYDRPLAPWLYRIATNRALSLLRKQAVRVRVHGQSITEEKDLQELYMKRRNNSPMQSSFEDHYVARELLCEALKQLSEEDAACLVLHFVSGERYADIAMRLGLTSEAVRKRVSRALTTLRKTYTVLDWEVRS